MKVKPVSEKIFTPVTLEITIETKQELAALWCATNSTITALQNSVGGHRNIREALGEDPQAALFDLFKAIDAHARSSGLKG